MYALGIDLGTTFTAAAVWRDGRAGICSLGSRTAAVPSVVLVREDGSALTGEAANRRALTEPHRVAREFKRRFGDSTPIFLGGTPYSPEALTARLLSAVVSEVVTREGGAPATICLCHPANWGPFKTDLLQQAVRLANLSYPVTLTSEPEAAAVFYAQEERLRPGEVIAVYDLGGGTFDSAVLRRTASGFEILGQPEGIERLGGIDIDAAVFTHVASALDGALDALDEDDPAAVAAVARLRQECTDAKEALSADTDVTIPVILPGRSTEVRLTRAELEGLVRPALYDSIGALQRALQSAEVPPEELHSVLLVGGSSRMPLVAQLVGAELGRPVAVDAHPKHAVALGAAWVAAAAASGRAPVVAPPRGAGGPGRQGGPGGPGGSGGPRASATAPTVLQPPVPPGPAAGAAPGAGAGAVRGAAAGAAAAGAGMAAAATAGPGAPGAGAAGGGAAPGDKTVRFPDPGPVRTPPPTQQNPRVQQPPRPGAGGRPQSPAQTPPRPPEQPTRLMGASAGAWSPPAADRGARQPSAPPPVPPAMPPAGFAPPSAPRPSARPSAPSPAPAPSSARSSSRSSAMPPPGYGAGSPPPGYGAGPRPTAPPPGGPRPGPGTSRRRRNPWRTTLLAVVLLAVLGGGGWALASSLKGFASMRNGAGTQTGGATTPSTQPATTPSTGPSPTASTSAPTNAATSGVVRLVLSQPDGGAGGSVTVQPGNNHCVQACSLTFQLPAVVTITAQAKPGYTVIPWTGSTCFDVTPCVLRMPRLGTSLEVHGGFQKGLLVSVTVHGTGEVRSDDGRLDCTLSCSATYPAGSQVLLHPADLTHFSGWTGCTDMTSGAGCGVSGTQAGTVNLVATFGAASSPSSSTSPSPSASPSP